MTYRRWNFDPLLTYSFMTVHSPNLSRPFNQWAHVHSDQGFSWRPGSVSFGTIDSNGPFPTTVELRKSYIPSSQAIRIIKVPFEVGPEGIIFSDPNEGWPVLIPAGYYAVYFAIEPIGEDVWRYTITFVPSESEVKAEIIKADNLLSPPPELLMEAEPA